jgi:hypothetical protein
MHIFDKLFDSPQIIVDYNPYKIETNRRALVLFKTDWYGPFGERSIKTGTTQFQVYESTRILNKLGYLVTIVDRSHKEKLRFNYDLFYGLAIGGSGKYFDYYYNQIPHNSIKIALSTGPNDAVSKIKFQDRMDYFKGRHGTILDSPSRALQKPHNQIISKCDALFYHGNAVVLEGYSDIKIPKYKLPTPIKDTIKLNFQTLDQKYKYRDNFLFYCGGGVMTKGLDIIIDAFLELPDFKLYIATLSDEKEFFNFYRDKIKRSTNIEYLGGIESDSRYMVDITSKCAFALSASCRDGDPAALMECMRYGLVPLITRDTDISFKDALLFKDYRLESIKTGIKTASSLDQDNYIRLAKNSYISSLENYSSNYSIAIEQAFCNTITNKVS